MIGGYMNYFHLKWNDVLWDLDYLNLGMLSATVPSYNDDEESESPETIATKFNQQKLNNFLD